MLKRNDVVSFAIYAYTQLDHELTECCFYHDLSAIKNQEMHMILLLTSHKMLTLVLINISTFGLNHCT